MSKQNRKKHIKMINLMIQAVAVIQGHLSSGNFQKALLLLAECQDSAIALGSHVEKLYGFQTKTVAALEQYCNALYQVSVAMEETPKQLGMALQGLAEAIDDVYSVYGDEFPERKEIVFLPYNASMWDSLESVWKAAEEDPECDVYVVPIPYYDLDENRNFIEKHYEGDMYPDYVPISHYEAFDLEEHHPDVIFIHNPYDEANRVTSIAPEFYSSRIKDFTDKLVYIPYFMLNEINPANQAVIDNMKHFCYLPGTIYANQVIVQSEAMRQIYINEYLKAAQQNGELIAREILEKKILGIGSPKLDKVASVRKEDLDIPKEWQNIIQKPDGSWKKVVFYNTSIAAFLQDSERMIGKMKDVLRIFKAQKDEIALLWRPHPLMLQTIESMRPTLLQTYLELVDAYREEGWGIYDDTADMQRAVILSDAYYGDPSSVVQVYKETGKPIMIQNVLVQE
ncbi:MAG: hypothetical protein IJA07_04465 [Agathobacter sp.]|nr:hypothetical protein [Agathobacter sp.]